MTMQWLNKRKINGPCILKISLFYFKIYVKRLVSCTQFFIYILSILDMIIETIVKQELPWFLGVIVPPFL